jgi:hypothetical protein
MNRQIDGWGRVWFDADDAIELLFQGHDITQLCIASSPDIDAYNAVCVEHDKLGHVLAPISVPAVSPEDDARTRQDSWWMPEEYKQLDVRARLLGLCRDHREELRVIMEMDMFEARGLLMVLRLMCFLVDHWRRNGVVWGVGRGSSVASHCLFLIGVHHIDALKYDLDITEFLK